MTEIVGFDRDVTPRGHPDPNAFLREMFYGDWFFCIGVHETLFKLSSNLGTVS